jgi:hypothetical protein
MGDCCVSLVAAKASIHVVSFLTPDLVQTTHFLWGLVFLSVGGIILRNVFRRALGGGLSEGLAADGDSGTCLWVLKMAFTRSVL